ncbi:MAG: chemotaxis protein CheW [Gammaproteobacteria bacterium]|nr:MAG: chemotaxis protein CheW [Gammaproteobacteria bacterium]
MLPVETLNQDPGSGGELLFDLGGAIEDDQDLQRHTVLVGSIGLVLPADEISELIEKAVVCELPNTPSWFNGVTSIRGNMIPVFDLHELFSIEQPAAGRRLIVVGENEIAAAFWVDDFPRLLAFADEDVTSIEPQVPSLIREHARQYFMNDGEAWVEWDFKSFFAALGEQL